MSLDPARPRTIALLHPGAMGATVGASLRAAGHRVFWSPDGRSAATAERAAAAGLEDGGALADTVRASDVVLSVCPPHAAMAVAEAVLAAGFRGLYVDANAVSPQRARAIAEHVVATGASFVDGGIVGPPAVKPGTTWLHLSGPRAAEVAALVTAGPLHVAAVSDRVGDASALKMCFAAYTKGTTALLAASLAAAERLGVRAALDAQREALEPGSDAELAERVRRSSAKAWRFEGEMHEIADTFAAAGVPEGFHRAAADVYRRMAGLSARSEMPPFEEVLEALLAEE
jgi:3-hydroxyisobutyrate dehydrogenase-like beta-hydroxyacid dehydrogenase